MRDNLEYSTPTMYLDSASTKEMSREIHLLREDDFERKYGRPKPKNVLNAAAFNLHAYQNCIILNGETLTAKQYRVQQVITFFCFAASVSSLVVSTLFLEIPWAPVPRAQRSQYWFRHDGLFKTNLTFAALCAGPQVLLTLIMVKQYMRSWQLAKSGKKIWLPKIRSISDFALLRLIAQDINIFFWVLSNAYGLDKKCVWFNHLVTACCLISYSTIIFQMTLDMIWADCLGPWLDKDGRPETSLPGRKSWKYTPDPIILEQPLGWRHLPKVLLWLAVQSVIIFYAIWYSVRGGIGDAETIKINRNNQALGVPACNKATYSCNWDKGYLALVGALTALVFLHAIIVFYYIEHGKSKLARAGPYLQWERPHKMLKILEGSCGWLTTVGILSTITLFIGRVHCVQMPVTWFVILPLQVTSSVIACQNAYYYFPRCANKGDAVLQGWLRELVWISDDVQRLRKTIITAIPDFRHLLEKEPLFCFDEAAKLLLWSDLVYTIEDKAKAPGGERTVEKECWGLCCPCCGKTTHQGRNEHEEPGSELAAETLEQSGVSKEFAQEMPAANPLPGHHASQREKPTQHLQAPHSQEINGRSIDDRVRNGLRSSSGSGPLHPQPHDESVVPEGLVSLVLSQDGHLRQRNSDAKIEIQDGVGSRAELGLAMRLFSLSDFEILFEEKLQSKVLRQPHHIFRRASRMLGDAPLIHGGFLKSWLSSGLHKTVVARVRSVVSKSTVQKADFRIYVTGHSLGGALATLAAVEIALEGDMPEVKCITFGAPRTGNHAFVRKSNQLVPDTWHIINDRDAVPRIGKLGFLFKRSGQRVLINRTGDCRVRPDPMQVSIHQEGFSVKEHMLAAYRRSLAVVLKSQLIPVRRRTGGLEAFEAFAADEDMQLLGLYLGLDMRKLLHTPASEIKVPKRLQGSIFGHFGYLRIFKIMIQGTQLVLGPKIASFLREVIYRSVRSEDDDISVDDTDHGNSLTLTEATANRL